MNNNPNLARAELNNCTTISPKDYPSIIPPKILPHLTLNPTTITCHRQCKRAQLWWNKFPASTAFGRKLKGCFDAKIREGSSFEITIQTGIEHREIAKKTGYNRKTVSKYVNSSVPHVAKKAIASRPYIIQRLNCYPLTASRIVRSRKKDLREIYKCQKTNQW